MSEALVPISAIEVGDRFRRDMGDLDGLAASIDRVGLLHAIVVTGGTNAQWRLVAGERRLRACAMLGWERVPVRVVTTTDLLAAEHDENAVRLDFSPSEAVAIADALRPAAEAQARERQGTRTDLGQEPPATLARSRDTLAAAVGMGHTTLARATEVVRAADADPTLQPLVEHMDETGEVAPMHKALKALPEAPTPEQVQKAIADRDAAYDRNFPGWREKEAADAAVERWWDSWKAIGREIVRQVPGDVIALLDAESVELLEADLVDLRTFLAACEAAIEATRRPHLVKGGDS